MQTQRSPLSGSGVGAPGTGRALASSPPFAPARGNGRGLAPEGPSGFEAAREALRREEREARLARADHAARGPVPAEERRPFTSPERTGSEARADRDRASSPSQRGIRRAERSVQDAQDISHEGPAGALDGPSTATGTSRAAPGLVEGDDGQDPARAADLSSDPAFAAGAGPALAALPPSGAPGVPTTPVTAAGAPQAPPVGPAPEGAGPSDASGGTAPGAGGATPRSAPLTGGPAASAAGAAPLGPDPSIAEAAEVLRQLKAELHRGLRRVRIDLDPPELGRLVVRVALQQGVLRAVVEADSPATLDLLQRQAPELRAALAEHGVAAEGLTLRLGSEPSRGGAQQQGARRGAGPRAALSSIDQRASEPLGPPARGTSLLDNDNGVDTYA